MMTSHGTLFLSRKTKPQAMRAKDGVFALTLLAFDRQGTHQVEAYRLIWSGPGALAFWNARASEMQPGVALEVELTRVRPFIVEGKSTTAEINAHVNSLQLRPFNSNCSQHLQAKTHCSAYAASTDSYQHRSE